MIDLMVQGIRANQSKAVGAVSEMAKAISGEINDGDYAFGKVAVGTGVDTALSSFSDKIVNGFDSLIHRLSAIANGVNFTVPAAASGGMIPYSVSSAVYSQRDGGASDETSDIASVIIQSVASAAEAIVNAIEENGGRPINLDGRRITQAVLSNINSQTRAEGKSPLLS